MTRHRADRAVRKATSKRAATNKPPEMVMKPFPENTADYTDEELGKKVLAHWIAFHAELKGIDLRAVRQYTSAFQGLVEITAQYEAGNSSHTSIVQILRLAAQGEFSRSGNLLKQEIARLGIETFRDQQAAFYAAYLIRQRRTSSNATRERSVQAAARREVWKKVGRELREAHPKWSDSHLANEISRKSEVRGSANTIRGYLKEMGLSLKKE